MAKYNDKVKAFNVTPRGRYKQHKDNAVSRSIKFKLTFEEWIAIWGDDYKDRGQGRDKLCMCRVGDKGAYRIGNVFIETNLYNVKTVDVNKFKYKKKLTKKKVKKIRKLIVKGYRSVVIGDKFKVSRQTIADIKAGRTWQ